MKSSRYDYFETGFNTEFQQNQKTFLNIDFASLIDSSSIKYTIPLKYQYRPDLIAAEFYGDPKLWWVLVYANKMNNCPEDFFSTNIITIPNPNKVKNFI